MSKITTNNKQMNFLDLLKFILALMIVAIHVHPFGTDTSLSTNINNADFWLTDCLARIAVPFYFVCSGYFVFRKINLEDFDKRVPLNAAVRFLRLYLIWTIIYLPLITKQVVNNENGILYGVVLEIRNILFVGSYIQLWYLNALAVAIVLVTILLQKKISVKKILLFSIIIYLIGLLGESYFGLIKPLEQYPFIWTSLELVKMVIKTTRNGFFFGFIFVALGLYFSKTEHLLKMKHAAIGFSVSMIALFLEVSFVTLNNWRRDDDMYVSLLPVTFFLFSLALQVKLKDHKCWKSFRLTSSLVYYTHTMVIECVSLFLAVWKVNVIGTSWHFVLTAVVSILLSCLIIKLSSIEKLSWLKKIYI